MDRRTFYCDVDDTLLMHDLSDYDYSTRIEVTCNGRAFIGVRNNKGINLLIKFWKLGYDVYVWSKTGKSWAKAVVERLGLEEYVTDCLSKPDFYADDRDVTEWIGTRIYRGPLD